jgi:lipopolysaccharide exporter
LNTEGGLLGRAVRGGLWVSGLRLTQQVLMALRLVILARLLSPNDFGLMGIALLMLTVVESLTQTGFSLALVQRKEQPEGYLNSAWTIEVLRGVGLFGILQVLASPAAGFFASHDAEMLIRVIGVSLVLRGLLNPGTVYFRRELQFDRQFIYEFSGRAADFIVAVIAGVILRNAWVLVLAYVSGDLVRVIASYLIHPYRPRFEIRLLKIRELFDFGKWILGAAAAVFFLNRGDKALVGKILGATMLGFYEMAFKISTLSASEFALVISEVTMPAYSKLQDKIERLREGYLRVLQITAFFCVPLAGLIFLLAPEFTRVFLGDKWLMAVPAMRALAVGGALRSLMATTGAVYMATGKPRIITKFLFVHLVVLGGLIFPFTHRWGIVGAGAAVSVAAIPAAVLFLGGVLRITRCPAGQPLRLIGFPAVATLAACLAVWGLRAMGQVWGSSILDFGLPAAVYAGAYLGVTALFGRFWGYRLTPLLKEMLGAVRRR